MQFVSDSTTWNFLEVFSRHASMDLLFWFSHRLDSLVEPDEDQNELDIEHALQTKAMMKTVLCSLSAWLLALSTFTSQQTNAAPPIAKAKDVEFTVTYSADTLAAGDMLYAQITIKNITNTPVRIRNFLCLVIVATTPHVREYVESYGEIPLGATFLEIAPNESFTCERCLDLYGNDHRDDGSFDPFDPTLSGQKMTLTATASTTIHGDVGLEGVTDWRDHALKATGKITFTPPLMSRESYETLIKNASSEGTRETFVTNFSPKVSGNARLYSNPRDDSRVCKLVSETLPADSSSRRAAMITLAVNEFAKTKRINVEFNALRIIATTLQNCSEVEKRAFWMSTINHELESETLQLQMGVPKEKRSCFANTLPKVRVHNFAANAIEVHSCVWHLDWRHSLKTFIEFIDVASL
ncbi:hypothetical protein [Novipirellula maiorica]|nr:hypothetical protein [Rhodopirellula maiorica]